MPQATSLKGISAAVSFQRSQIQSPVGLDLHLSEEMDQITSQLRVSLSQPHGFNHSMRQGSKSQNTTESAIARTF